jgi:NitT/TauT family transport system substrate-binding protein
MMIRLPFTPIKPFARTRRLALLFALAIALTIFMNGCSLNQTPALTPLRIGITTWPGFDIILYAKAEGLFEQRGLDVELVRFDNQQDSSRAVMRGRLDGAFVALWDIMQVDPGQDKPVFVMATNISHGSDGILAQPGIQSIAELQGKQIAAKLGTVNHLILLEALKFHGIDPKNINIEDISNDLAAQMMRNGEVDAAVLWQPLLGNVANDIDGVIVHTTAELDSLVIDGLIARGELVQTETTKFKQFILAWFDLMHAVETEPDRVFEIVAQQLNQSTESFAKDYAGLLKGDIAMQKQFFEDGKLTEIAQDIAQLLRDDPRHGRIIRNDVEFNPTPVMSAIEEWMS